MSINRQSLHSAVIVGDKDAVIDILAQSTDEINLKDSKGCTPLMLAECVKDKYDAEKIKTILIEKGADVNICNNIPLYSAVFYGNAHLVEMLLKAGADVAENNLLHISAENGNHVILGMLLKSERCTRDVINRQDKFGRTPAFIAAQHDHKICLKILILNGADLTCVSISGESVLNVIFESISQPTQFLKDVWNTCLRCERKNEKFLYHVDFSIISSASCVRQMKIISKLLISANDEEKTEILQHPLIELYLTLKWSKAGYFFYLWITFYVIFVLSLSIYLTILTRDLKSKAEQTLIASKCILIITATCLLGHAILQCCLTHRNHFTKYEMLVNLICTSLSLVIAYTENYVGRDVSTQTMPHWFIHVISFVVLLAWIELMLLIGRLPTYGYYALMFSAVLQNVIKVLMAFLCLVVGFALSFSIQFSNNDEFSDPWSALIKTIAMMMGEFEYGVLFTDKLIGPERATSRIIFLMFVILTSIVLMNLMVGLAVSDIQCLQMVSHARKLEKQADFLNELEKVLSSNKIRGYYIKKIVKRILGRNCVASRYELETSAKFRRSRKLSSKLIESLVEIARSQREMNSSENLDMKSSSSQFQ